MNIILRRTFVAGLALAPWLVHSRGNAAPPLLLAGVAGDELDPAPYLVSEKYDGVRALWDGNVLHFRSGREVRAPDWFTRRLPRQALDGELWIARRRFDLLSGLVRKTEPVGSEWRDVRYMLFELPGAPGTFAQRYESMRRIVDEVNWPSLQRVPQTHVADRLSLARALDEVVRAGGEGLMLHRADAPYVTGRSDVLLKLKPLRDDEAIVVAHIAGKGKYARMMGALELQTPNGLRFRIGTGFSDELRRRPPAIGSTVTYAYRELTPAGVPRFASFSRTWDGS